MKSSIEGCVRMCPNCPNRATSARLFTPEIMRALQASIASGDNGDTTDLMPDVDPLDINRVATSKHMDFKDYGKKYANAVYTASLSREGTLRVGAMEFPYNTTLAMVEACTGPTRVKIGLFRTALKCGAYSNALANLGWEPSALKVYNEYLERQNDATRNTLALLRRQR